MKKILVIGTRHAARDKRPSKNAFQQYLTEAMGTSASVDAVYYDEVVIGIAPGVFTAVAPRKDIDLADYQALALRGRRTDDFFLAKFCAYHGIPCVNDYSNFFQPNKLAQATVFLEAGVPFPATYFSADQSLLITHAADTFGYPYILKANNGTQGDSNYLIRTAAEAKQALDREPDVEFIAQEYCPNDRDYRLLLVGDNMLLFERRGGTDTHLNNTSKGGTATALELTTVPEETLLQAKSLANSLGLKIAGFDIIPKLGTEQLYFLEINYQPQLRTGALVAEKQALVRQLFESF